MPTILSLPDVPAASLLLAGEREARRTGADVRDADPHQLLNPLGVGARLGRQLPPRAHATRRLLPASHRLVHRLHLAEPARVAWYVLQPLAVQLVRRRQLYLRQQP